MPFDRAAGQSFISSYRLYHLCLFCCLADKAELGAAEAMNPCMLLWAACFNTLWCGSRTVLKASLKLRIRCQRWAIWIAYGAALRAASA
jgi:hypothetical protein